MDPQELELNSATGELPVDLKEDNKQLRQILLTCNQLKKIKQNLNKMIDSLAENPSILSRAAKLWNTIPWWQKLIAGLVLTIPLLLAGIFAQIAVLTTLSICIMVAYTISSFALDNHQSHNINNTAQLKSTIGNLADLLGTSIRLLQSLHEMIATQIDAFREENIQLTQKINELIPELERLTLYIGELEQIKQTLGKTIEELEQTLNTLKTSEQEQTRLIEKTRQELEQVKSSYEENEQKLTTSTNELIEHNNLLKSQLQLAKNIAKALQEALTTFNDQILSNEEQKTAFSQRLADILNNKEQSFGEVIHQLNQSEQNIKTVTNQLVDLNHEYDSFLDRLEAATLYMENQLSKAKECEPRLKIKPSVNGFYSEPTKTPIIVEARINTIESIDVPIVSGSYERSITQRTDRNSCLIQNSRQHEAFSPLTLS